MSRNSIFLNGGLGIDLNNDGMTDNDPTDADTGANTLINFPLITNATSDNANITVIGSVNTASPNTTVVEIFISALPSPGGDPSGFGEGQTFAATAVPNSAGMFTATFASGPTVVITATTTDAVGNTSEFSPVFVIGAGQADLIVTDLTATPSTVLAGATTTVQFSIRNMGSVSSTAARNDIVLSANSTIDSQDSVIASVSSGALAPGAAQSFSLDITIPAQGTMGDVFIGVIADAQSAVTESAEDNNTASVQITVISMPDLTVRNLTVNPLSANPGDIVRIDFTINNQGSANAGPHVEEVRLSSDQNITSDDILLQSLTSAGIGAGANTQFVLNIQIPNNVTPGQFFIGVVTDARNTVNETSETNNIATASLALSGSIDLTPSNLSLTPNSIAPGGQVAISFTLTNSGTIAAPISMNELRLSTDQNITSADILLGRVTSNPLSPGQSLTVSFTATIPTSLAPGIFFVGAIADAQAQINESNETNNITTAALTIADQAAPRVTIQSPNGGETVIAGEPFTIRFTSVDDVAVISQDIFLSLDSGTTFSQVIVTGLSGTANSFVWSVPAGLNTGNARVQVVARDGAGNLGVGISAANFSIGLRPVIISPQINSGNGKLKFLSAGSNILPGATLIVVNGSSRESFPTALNNSGTRFIIKGRTTSSPSGIALRDAIPRGVTVQLIVRNPNGIESTPIPFQK
jgi:hypothetical protein